jgi:GTPase SAR1 family protein
MSKVVGVFAFLLVMTCINPVFGEDEKMITLEELRWKNRIILVFINEDTDSEVIREVFKEYADEIDDRDIRFFIIGKQIETNGKETLAKEYVKQLKKNYNVNDETLTVILIGKDGGEKYRRDRLDLEEIDHVIDAMPMRRQEMERKRHS